LSYKQSIESGEILKVTRTVRYGIRALVEIALHKDKNYKIKKKQIAKSIDVPISFLENILSMLCKGGLINSTAGIYGGYCLNKPISEIKISDIFVCLEEDYTLVNCTTDENSCNKTESCPTNKFWLKLYKHIDLVFKNVSLQNIINGELDYGKIPGE
jgi:Rrf2 family cysteine metabolism transcriptional repressor